MQPDKECPIRRFEDGVGRSAADRVIHEARIELNVNDGQLRLAMLCLPIDLEALAVGFLAGEGALKDPADLDRVQWLPESGQVLLDGDFDADVLENIRTRWAWGTGCGGGGTSRDMNAPARGTVGAGPAVTPDQLLTLAEQFRRKTTLWRQTGGVHACALAEATGIALFAEDIGRHNAFDKVNGRAFLDRVDLADKIMLATGRLTAEIVSKAVSCRVPMLVSRSAVTSLAVDLARRFGLTLVGFLRGRRMNVYTGYQRVTAPPAE